MKGSVTRRGGGLGALAARLESVAGGSHELEATRAAAEPLDAAVKASTAGHYLTGELQRTAGVRVGGAGELVVEGPRYMPFVIGRGHDDADVAEARRRYVETTIDALRGR